MSPSALLEDRAPSCMLYSMVECRAWGSPDHSPHHSRHADTCGKCHEAHMPPFHVALRHSQLHKSAAENCIFRGCLGAMKKTHCRVSFVSQGVLVKTRLTAHTITERTTYKGFLDIPLCPDNAVV